MSRLVCTRELAPEIPCICPICGASAYIVAWWLTGIGAAVGVGRWLRLLLTGVLLLTVSCGGHLPPTPTPTVMTIHVEVYNDNAAGGGKVPGATVSYYGSDPTRRITGQADSDGNFTFTPPAGGYSVCGVLPPKWPKERCAGVTVTPSAPSAIAHITLTPIAPPPPPAPQIHADGRIFRTADGKPWRYKGVSAFKLLKLFEQGQDITPFLKTYVGFNVLRVWEYTPAKDWGAQAWEPSPVTVTRDFLTAVAKQGWVVELTLLTDDDPARLAWAKAFLPQLVAGGCPAGLLLELGNEPTTHKSINTAALRATADASGCLYASGNYEDSAKAFGNYLVTHTQRDAEWPRRSHDCLEFYNGGGPNAPSDPAHHVPCVLDEPPKLEDVGYSVDDWRGYFGSGAQMGGGVTFHSQTGKYAQLPTDQELQLARAALEALNAFPADAPLGAYSRPVENSLRTYIIGTTMTRIRPTSPEYGTGWTRTGTSNVLWIR